jgi:hypothetical protein
MKKLLSVFSITLVLVACNNNPDLAIENAKLQAYKDSVKLAADTAGLAQYQALKAQNELASIEDYNQAQYAAVAPVKSAVSYAPARKTTRSSSAASRNRSNSYEGGSMSSESTNAAKRKQGWSKAAKGAAIGGGSGAVLGAVINKRNRVVGGVIGGVVGGAVGYGIGRGMDKRDGRY